MVGRPFPKYSQETLDVNWSTLTQVLESVSAFDWSLFRQAMASTGDIGSATKAVLEKAKAKKQTELAETSLNIIEVRAGTGSHRSNLRRRRKNQKRTLNNRAAKPSYAR